MLMLIFIRDLGSSLMFFGAFLSLLYVATARLSLVIAGLALASLPIVALYVVGQRAFVQGLTAGAIHGE